MGNIRLNVLHLIQILYVLFLLLVGYSFGGNSPAKCGMCVLDRNVSSVSCGHLLWKVVSKSNCTLWLPPKAPARNSSECAALKFDHDSRKSSDFLRTVSLKPYYYHEDGWNQTVLNVTISNINWADFKMRFQRLRDPGINFCRHFTISSNEPVPAEAMLFYDCLWIFGGYEGMEYVLEYVASKDEDKSVGKFLFFVPSRNEINPKKRYINVSKIFCYMEVSDWPVLRLRLQVPQEDFYDATVDSIKQYNVILHYSRMNSSTKSLKLSPQSSEVDPHEMTYEYDTRYEGGDYYFTVQIEHENCSLYKDGCAVSKTPIYSAPEDIHLRLLIGIVGCGGALLSIFVFVYFLWRWSQRYRSGNLPTVLIIYTPTTTSHMRCAEEFAKFLQNVCYVNALLDVVEIPKTANQDPFVWCNDAFQHADFVMILSSPYQQCNNYEGIYKNVDVLGLRHVKEKLSDRKSKQHFLTVILPYCTEKDLPSEAKNLKQFFIPKDLVKLLSFFHSNSYQGEVELEEDGGAFLEALSKAEAEVASQKCICVNGQCHKLSIDDLDTVDLTPSKDSSEDLLLPQREKASSDLLNMYPGPLENLNLLGSNGDEVSDITNQTQTAKKLVVDLNDLNLG